jgi:RNA 3'-terminal phosphate cyclase (ATP)
MDFILIDGSEGEGGGQMVRTALALSAVTGKPFRIVNIRANRPNPGLRNQHVQCVIATQRICGAQSEGALKHSRELSFIPGKITAGKHVIDIGTAGSTSLVLQTIALPLSLADGPSEVTIMGGTHVEWSPVHDYLELAWLPFMRKIGLDMDLEMVSPGFYPRGGGEVRARIRPAKELAALSATERGELKRVGVLGVVNNLPLEIAERFVRRAESQLKSRRVRKIEAHVRVFSCAGAGAYVRLLAEYENVAACFSGLGRIGKQAEKIADETVEEFFEFHRSGAAVDAHLADQLLPPLALAKGESVFSTPRISAHFGTNAAVIAKFLPASITAVPAGEATLVTVRAQI